jgi:hypothetical protein
MAEDIFESLAHQEPDRQEEVDDLDVDSSASASQREGESPNDSDLQTTLKMLNPP